MVLYRLVGSKYDNGSLEQTASLAWRYLRQMLRMVNSRGYLSFCLPEGRVVKSGGTALTLLALAARVACSKARPDDIRVLRYLAWFLISQQHTSGRFASMIDLVAGSEIQFSSLYYPGQSVLALATAYQITGESAFIECADRGMRYIAQQHARVPPTPGGFADHWAMLALNALHSVAPDPWHLKHLRFLSDPLLDGAESGEISWLDADHTTKVSIRLEGLLASLDVELRVGEQSRTARLLRTVLAGLHRCQTRQIGSPEAAVQSDNPLAHGGVVATTAKPTIRIDDVQHFLAASLEVDQVLSRAVSYLRLEERD
jgi:hypothetical protein